MVSFMKFILHFAICGALILFSLPVLAQTAQDTVISNVMARDAENTNIILVDKSSGTLHTVTAEGNNITFGETYPIIYGSNQGDKQVSGDNKTPEGVYYITNWTSGDWLVKRYGNYAKIYGSGAFPINYPNLVDKIRKKTGHGIWIHGRDPIGGKDTTQGCVALHNEDLMSLYSFAKVKDPVIIADKALYLTKDRYDELYKELFGAFDGFIDSWRYSDFNTFQGYIHGDFKGQGKSASGYLSSKKYLMERFKDKVITNEDTKIFIKDENNFLVDTRQFYCAQNITSYSNKRYYFVKDGSNVKLLGEEAFSLPFGDVIKSATETFVADWAEAWRSADIDKYITFYSDKFKNGRMNKDAWHQYKKNVFEKAGTINLEISNISWDEANNIYRVSFNQKYSGGAVSDEDIKTLVFEGCPGNFKIISETWKAN